MDFARYKKMAGTSAVFLLADFDNASPVERDGLEWGLEELHFNALIEHVLKEDILATSLFSQDLPPEKFWQQLNTIFQALILQAKEQGRQKPSMATVLALEGLEEYDPPGHGDIRQVEALNTAFIYNVRIKGWIQIPSTD